MNKRINDVLIKGINWGINKRTNEVFETKSLQLKKLRKLIVLQAIIYNCPNINGSVQGVQFQSVKRNYFLNDLLFKKNISKSI